MNNLELLKTLSESFGPSGFEDDVRETIQKIIGRDWPTTS